MATLDRVGDGAGLDEGQRALLVADTEEDLEALIDDAENRRIGEQGAREMRLIRALIRWFEGGDPPGAEAIDYLERGVKAFPRDPDEDELALRNSYLAAIGELGEDAEAASRLWREPEQGWGDPEQYRRLIAFQGRRIRGLIEERGLTVGEAARRSGIDTVTLVSILFGFEEMRFREWVGLADALDVDLGWFMEGVKFVPDPGRDGKGIVVTDPALDRRPPADRPTDDGPGDAR